MSEHQVVLPYQPREWQRRIHLCKKKRIVIMAHRRSGKTVASKMELVQRSLESAKYESAYIAPFLSQARRVMWSQLKDMALIIPHTQVRETEMLITFANGSSIRCLGADSADGIRGLGFDFIVGDEMADWEPTVLTQVVMPTLAGRDGRITLIGTPKGTDPLSELFDSKSQDDKWQCFKFTVDDTHSIPADELEQIRKDTPPAIFALEYMCDPSLGTVDALMSTGDVEAAIARVIPEYEYDHEPVVLGVDAARYGDDRTVIFRRQGARAFAPRIMKKASSSDIAAAVAEEYHKYNADAVFIDGTGGYGSGIEDQLIPRGIYPISIHFNGKPQSDRYRNIRAEIWFKMASWIRCIGSIPDLPGFKSELTVPRYQLGDDNKLKLETKEDIKERMQFSPDLADALALTFVYPVDKLPRNIGKARYEVPDWDPFKDA